MRASVWATNYGSDTVTSLDATSGEQIGKPIPTGAYPKGIAVGLGAVWVANAGECTLTRIVPWRMPRVSRLLAAGAAAAIGGALWWRTHPSACPYRQRFWVEAPHPFVTRARLREALAPRPGERMLEVGPGTGYYTLDVAERVGRLDVLDLQQEMLDHVMRRARERGIGNVDPTQGDAQALPYPDDTFDAAYLVAVLGEVPDQDAALRELARVLRPDGRLVVGELFGDPHWVSPTSLRRRAERAGLRFERRAGRLLGHYSVFRA
jgi:SAM-dependent methyltransferase